MSKALKILGLVMAGAVLIAVGVAVGVMIRSRLPFGAERQAVLDNPRGMMQGRASGDEFPSRSGMMGRGGDRRGDLRGDGRGGMMGGYVPDSDLVPADGETLTLDQAAGVAEAYLDDYGDDNLEIAEVMQFDNNSYAAIREKDTGIGAFEILIDPETAAVSSEPGPNMMWNTKYRMMGNRRGMMGGDVGDDVSNEMKVTADEARKLAQTVLDKRMPGTKLAEDAETFYGYYTIDTLQDGKTVGMLSVNGFTGRVWLHTWHGKFIDMTEEDD